MRRSRVWAILLLSVTTTMAAPGPSAADVPAAPEPAPIPRATGAALQERLAEIDRLLQKGRSLGRHDATAARAKFDEAARAIELLGDGPARAEVVRKETFDVAVDSPSGKRVAADAEGAVLDPITSVHVSSDGKTIEIGGAIIECPDDGARCALVGPAAARLATVSRDGTARATLVGSSLEFGRRGQAHVQSFFRDVVGGLAFSDRGAALAVQVNDRISVFETASGSLMNDIPMSCGRSADLDFVRGGLTLAWTCHGKSFLAHATGGPPLQIRADRTIAVATDPTGNVYVASGVEVLRFDPLWGDLRRVATQSSRISALAAAGDGRLAIGTNGAVAVGGPNGWMELRGFDREVAGLVFGPEDRALVGWADGSPEARVWSVTTGEELARLERFVIPGRPPRTFVAAFTTSGAFEILGDAASVPLQCRAGPRLFDREACEARSSPGLLRRVLLRGQRD